MMRFLSLLLGCLLIMSCAKPIESGSPPSIPQTQPDHDSKSSELKQRVAELELELARKQKEAAKTEEELATVNKAFDQLVARIESLSKTPSPPAQFAPGDLTKIVTDKFKNPGLVASSQRQWEKLVEAAAIKDSEGVDAIQYERNFYRWKAGTNVRILKQVSKDPIIYEIRCVDMNASDDKRVETLGLLGYTSPQFLEKKSP